MLTEAQKHIMEEQQGSIEIELSHINRRLKEIGLTLLDVYVTAEPEGLTCGGCTVALPKPFHVDFLVQTPDGAVFVSEPGPR